ncbi:neuronal calcium sensor 1-like [Dermacentor andersoni]|uniref:neuronal calcium sensor 1-like n=1 Tax=Dermacentor andersoni TaxID=34620 RepID=UPI0021550D46|nr:frequenin-1-like [Dermacentor andersoni]
MGLTKSRSWRLHGDELIELVECTGLNPSILRRWHREFLKDFPRGFFTREEMKQVFGSMFPDGYPNAFMDIIFNAMDKRRIGYVTFRDFVKTIAITVSGTADDKLNWAFDVFDQKGDGFVTLDEMINVVEALWQLHGESPEMEDYKLHYIRRRTRQIFRRLDVKNDGRISRDQFREVLKQDHWIVKNVLHVYSSAVGAFSRVVQSS